MRLRITFSKTGPLRYIGHLDLFSLWERALRRAGLPLAYSQGFHPQPKMQLAAALPLGFSSRCEVLDIRLQQEIPLEGLLQQLEAVLPEDIRPLSLEQAEERAAPLQTRVDQAEYEITLPAEEAPPDLEARLLSLLNAASLPRQRRGKPYDLRPLIDALTLQSNDPPRLFLRLSAREAATGRPEEVLDALGIAAEVARVERTRLIFKPEPLQ